MLKKIRKYIQRLCASGFQASEKKIEQYFARDGHRGVQGWMSAQTLSMLLALNSIQKTNNIKGNFCEIGVYHGRFFIAFCLLRDKAEEALAIDVFDDQKLNLDNSGEGDYKKFIENIHTYIGSMENIHVMQSDSLTVTSDEIFRKLSGGKVRFFSVDGCHTTEHTASDLKLAAAVIELGGVIILDDFENEAWPGVIEGCAVFLMENDLVVPFAVAYNKLYLTHKNYSDSYLDYLFKCDRCSAIQVGSRKVGNFDVPQVVVSGPEIFYKESYLDFFDFSQSGNGKTCLGGHWFSPELWGVWSDGAQCAVVDLPLNESITVGTKMVISFHLYVSVLRGEQTVSLTVGGSYVETVQFQYGNDYQNFTYSLTEFDIKKKSIKVQFLVKEAVSPKDMGESLDDRKLGVGLRSISFY